ncbi:MAG TPA: alpha/beta fold hydrolase [Candidatus Eisenbacteria bacterium]|jgi:dipeptidyl aminopeptidase/acylaminoacyl peptidase|nr:alpha/beta fold hydrolase [Candidatus Eisenbacteria bacterium]
MEEQKNNGDPSVPDGKPLMTMEVEQSPLLLEGDDKLTLGRVLGMLGTALLVVLLPLSVTVAVGIFQMVRPDKVVSTRTPKDLGLAYEDVRLKTDDGIDVAAWYVPAETPSGSSVLALHGYPTDKGDILPRVAFLAKKYDLLLIDFRSFGESGGTYTTLGPKELADAQAGIAWLRAKGAKKIGVYGFSMGGAVGLMTLGGHPSPDAVAAEAAYADLWQVMEEPYKYLGPLKRACAWMTALAARAILGIDVDRASPAAAVADTKKPVLLIHSKNDKVVPFSHAELLKERLKDDPLAETWFTDNEGHGEPSTDFPAHVQDFFDRNLIPANP